VFLNFAFNYLIAISKAVSGQSYYRDFFGKRYFEVMVENGSAEQR